MESDLKQQPEETGGSLPTLPSDVSQPQVVVSGDLPPVMLPTVTRCVIDMTEEERDAHFREKGEEQYQHYLKSKATKCYNRCRKTDWCKVEQEKKAKEKQNQIEQIESLTKRLNEQAQLISDLSRLLKSS